LGSGVGVLAQPQANIPASAMVENASESFMNGPFEEIG
jgi:hypothetical protein